jgi:hypothetical protein
VVNPEVGSMASITHSGVFRLYGGRAASVADALGGRLKTLARRVNDGFEAQQRREIDKEIARLFAQSGGRLTDSVEREIGRTLLRSDWSLPY